VAGFAGVPAVVGVLDAETVLLTPVGAFFAASVTDARGRTGAVPDAVDSAPGDAAERPETEEARAAFAGAAADVFEGTKDVRRAAVVVVPVAGFAVPVVVGFAVVEEARDARPDVGVLVAVVEVAGLAAAVVDGMVFFGEVTAAGEALVADAAGDAPAPVFAGAAGEVLTEPEPNVPELRICEDRWMRIGYVTPTV
jgi:hypothetical protein